MSLKTISLFLLVLFSYIQSGYAAVCSPISSVPISITSSGSYCLTENLIYSETTGTAITINANDVVLDLDGWSIRGRHHGRISLAGGVSKAISVTGNAIIIKNGNVSGFNQAISISGSSGNAQPVIIKDIHFFDNTWWAINVKGENVLIKNNKITVDGRLDTNNSDYAASGIILSCNSNTGRGNRISGNTITNIFPKVNPLYPDRYLSHYGIQVSGCSDTIIDKNYISGGIEYSEGNTVGYGNIGIYVRFGRVTITQNTINNFYRALYFYNSLTSVYINNIANHIGVVPSGAIDGGNNNIFY